MLYVGKLVYGGQRWCGSQLVEGSDAGACCRWGAAVLLALSVVRSFILRECPRQWPSRSK